MVKYESVSNWEIGMVDSFERNPVVVSGTTSALPFSRPRRPTVRPVSRIIMELSDTTAFAASIREAVWWMSRRPRGSGHRRSGVMLPDEAFSGGSFDVTDEFGANPAKAIRLDAADGSIWAARLDWPDPEAPRTWISEFFVQQQVGQLVRFGAQLTCVIRGDCPDFGLSRPSVVQRIMEKLSAEADGFPLAANVGCSVVEEVPEIIQLLYNGQRQLPVIVISESEDSEDNVSADNLVRRFGGAAHIVSLSRDASWELTRRVGKRMSVFNGAVRLYEPGLTEDNEEPFAHPLWLKEDLTRVGVHQDIGNRVFPSAFLRRVPEPFPRYSYLRELRDRESLKIAKSSHKDVSRSEIEHLQNAVSEVTEERDQWLSMAQEEQTRRLEAQSEVQQLRADVARLEAKNRSLEYSLRHRPAVEIPSEMTAVRSLASYDEHQQETSRHNRRPSHVPPVTPHNDAGF